MLMPYGNTIRDRKKRLFFTFQIFLHISHKKVGRGEEVAFCAI